MDVKCKQHGMQSGIHVSKDIAENNNTQFKFMPTIVFFEFDDEIIPLPDDYPEWVLNLSPVCGECLKNILKEEYFVSKEYERGEWVL